MYRTLILISALFVFGPVAPGQEQTASTEPQNDQLTALEKVREQMAEVLLKFGQAETSVAQQELQHKIIAQLQALLDQQSKSQDQQNQTQEKKEQKKTPEEKVAGNESKDENEATTGDQKQTEQQARIRKDLQDKIWGHLPDRLRNQMQNIETDKFLPKYKQLIEAYYQRLSKEFVN